jgi:hypothetical protein
MPSTGASSFPSGSLVGGNTVREPIIQNHIFQSGIEKPEHSSVLTYIYPEYYLTALMDRMGAYEGVENAFFSWSKIGRTRVASEVEAVTIDTTSAVVRTSVAEGTPYYLVGDTVRFDSGAIGLVTAVGAASSKQTITVLKRTGGNWTSSLVDVGMNIGHVGTAFAEGTEGPSGRLFLPTEDYNNMQILKRTAKVSRTSVQTKTWLDGGKAWFWTNEEITIKEQMKDIEATILLGDLFQSRTGARSTRGILDWVLQEGIVKNYSPTLGVQESDLQAMIKDMLVQGASNDILVLCGSDFLIDVMNALKPYALNGGIQFGSLGDNVVGLDFLQYTVAGKRITFAHYLMFDDDRILPFADSPTTGKINFSKFGLFLDFGSENGRNLCLKYLEKDGIQSKFIHTVVPGTINPYGGQAGVGSNLFDGFQIQVLSEVGLEFRLPNRCGILKAQG